MYSPLLSLIIPVFNSEKTINRTLNSILSQTFTNFEILIIDGASSDGTLKIIKDYGKKDNRIRWRSEKDSGIYDAMNKGVKMSKGNWIYFLGSDDNLYDKNVLRNVFCTQHYENYDVIYGNVHSTRFGGLYDGEFNNEKILERNICHQAIFLKENVFEKVGNFNLKFKTQADWDHNIRWFFSRKIKYKYIDVIIANYADGGFSSVTNDLSFLDIKRMQYMRYAKDFLDFETKISWFWDELQLKSKRNDFRATLKVITYLPYILY